MKNSNKIKCMVCGKKISGHLAVMYTCKCKNVYCSDHKLQHECSYDYKTNDLDKPLLHLNNKITKI